MERETVEAALQRIEAALARVETATKRSARATQGLGARHERLRAAVTQSLRQIDDLLADHQR